jgi:hypothetical protein
MGRLGQTIGGAAWLLTLGRIGFALALVVFVFTLFRLLRNHDGDNAP